MSSYSSRSILKTNVEKPILVYVEDDNKVELHPSWVT